jgi:hypothetical protein
LDFEIWISAIMLKKLLLVIIILAIIAIVWLGGIFSVTFSPFSLKIRKPEKDFLKKVVRKIEGFVYHEATIHNPPGDMLPDQIDDNVKGEIKKIVN